MHKKMTIVGGKTVLLGSFKLTVAGTAGSDEMNVRVDSPDFARRAAAGFAHLREKAILASELKELITRGEKSTINPLNPRLRD